MTSLSDRTQGLADRSVGLAARLGGPTRDSQAVKLIMLDGSRIRGTLHRAPGTRTLDFLNRQAEGFLAITEAVVTLGDTTEDVAFVAVNKSHVVQVIELSDDA